METMRDVIFYGSKITADGDYSHEIKRCFLLGTKAMTKLYSILKKKKKQKTNQQRHYFVYKGLSSQNYGFSSSHEQM